MALLKRKRSGLNDPMSVVTRFVNACNRHDADGVSSCLHPEFDSIQPMYPTRNFRGADQVRRNWQAIFDAEPGFRLTVLRSAQMDDTIWLELHGAGRDAEVAGVFVMGVQGDRIRWARIYSALVEPVPAGTEEPMAAPLRQVPPYEEAPAAAADVEPEVVEEALIAPVLDMERSGRRRRRGRRGEPEGAEAPEDVVEEPAADEEAPVDFEAGAPVDALAAGDAVDFEAGPAVEPPTEAQPPPEPDVVVVDAGPETEVAVETAPDTEVVVVTDAEPDVVVVAPADDATDDATDDGPATEAVDMMTVTADAPGTEAEAEAPPEPTPEPPADEPAADEPAAWQPREPEPPRRLFGRKRP